MKTEAPRSMEWIRERCRIVDECWVWSLHSKEGRWPLISIRTRQEDGSKKDTFYYVRHLTHWLKHGRRPGLNNRSAIVTTCDSDLCVNPDHLKIATRSEVGKRSAGFQKNLTTRKKMSEARRKRAKLSDEAVAEIRQSEEPAKDAAAKHGVSPAYIYMLRSNLWRKDYSNPFAGLGG